jgi:4'-phosphopantetheinyl transferase
MLANGSIGSPTGWVEVWIDRLDLPAIEVAALTKFLTPAELTLCDRCRLPHVRQHKIVARARLRQILSGYLDQSPQEIEISIGLQGKPQVTGLEFNLSHSGDLVAYAISDRPVGIDIERVRSMDLSGIIQRFFAPSEFAAWQKLSSADQELAFFRTWTVKEAYLKAIGTGLYTPLSEVEVTIDQDPPMILQAPGSENWQLHLIKDHYGNDQCKGEFIQNQCVTIKSPNKNPPASAIAPIDLPIGYVGALVIAVDIDSNNYPHSAASSISARSISSPSAAQSTSARSHSK